MNLRQEIKRYRFEILFLTPLLLYIVGFTIGPVFYTIFLSFQEKFTSNFPTIANYQSIISHFQFREALFNTLAITLISLSLELLLGLALAVLLAKRFVGRGFLRAFVLFPLGIPTIVAASNMRYIFDTQGFLNECLYRLHIIASPIYWTGGGIKTIFVIALADTWKVTPLVMLVLLAGLESISEGLFDAAKVDGASSWTIFKKITLPLLKPFITIALILRGIDAFRLFELPLTLTGTSTPVISTYTYFEYFQYNNPHTSAASAVLLLVMIMISVTVYFTTVKEREIEY